MVGIVGIKEISYSYRSNIYFYLDKVSSTDPYITDEQVDIE